MHVCLLEKRHEAAFPMTFNQLANRGFSRLVGEVIVDFVEDKVVSSASPSNRYSCDGSVRQWIGLWLAKGGQYDELGAPKNESKWSNRGIYPEYR